MGYECCERMCARSAMPFETGICVGRECFVKDMIVSSGIARGGAGS